MPTTLEKMHALAAFVAETPPAELTDDGANLAELLQIVRGFGFDVLGMLIPASEAEADVLIDKLLVLAFSLRGDDLPPFDPDRYGEADLDHAA